jgi:hypothetical protein
MRIQLRTTHLLSEGALTSRHHAIRRAWAKRLKAKQLHLTAVEVQLERATIRLGFSKGVLDLLTVTASDIDAVVRTEHRGLFIP